MYDVYKEVTIVYIETVDMLIWLDTLKSTVVKILIQKSGYDRFTPWLKKVTQSRHRTENLGI